MILSKYYQMICQMQSLFQSKRITWLMTINSAFVQKSSSPWVHQEKNPISFSCVNNIFCYNWSWHVNASDPKRIKRSWLDQPDNEIHDWRGFRRQNWCKMVHWIWRSCKQFVEVIWVIFLCQFEKIKYSRALVFYPLHLRKHQLFDWKFPARCCGSR